MLRLQRRALYRSLTLWRSRAPRRAVATCHAVLLSSGASAKGAEATSANRRTSALGIQMISKSLHKQIFGDEPRVSKDAVEKSKKHLKSHGIDIGSIRSTELPDIDIDLPPLLGSDVNDHFIKIANQQIEPYLSLAKNLVDVSLPEMPKKWSFVSGWTQYYGNTPIAVPYPDEDALILDVEVCVRDSERPILATAVSPNYWYSWVSQRLIAHEDYDIEVQGKTTPGDLIPLESDVGCNEPLGGKWKKRIIVGHNVSYDRARIKEQYLMKVRDITPPEPKLDTSLTRTLNSIQLYYDRCSQRYIHLLSCVSFPGPPDQVSGHYELTCVCCWPNCFTENAMAKGSMHVGEGSFCPYILYPLIQHNGKNSEFDGSRESWLSVSSPNGLADVHWLHVGSHTGSPRIEKDKRDVFVKGRIQDVRKQFQVSCCCL